MKTNFLLRAGVAVAALMTTALVANAADLPRGPYKAPAYVAPVYANWTGFYVGLNAGYGFGQSNWDAPAISPSPKGFLGGLTLGYNFQTGTWLWGIEADGDYSAIKGSADCAGGTCETKLNWLATARGRLGYAGWNNWLPYLTGGAAIGNIKATSPVGDASKTQIGWTAGAGVEYAMWSNWSVKLEYLYVDLGKFDAGVAGATDNVSFNANIVRAGLNYRF
ncbi:MAG TPA: outer membrane protein [Pseudolabrys sp.]|jgi:outer membrane immunogenic protein|nr:outer membrane protein [Pseudolabrys sp.]